MPNPFTEQGEASPLYAPPAINAIEAISRAEIDTQIATAKKWPRDLAKVQRDMIAMATLDEETAESCFYNLPRAGKNIVGPSIKLAEIALTCYGNISLVNRVVEVVIDGPMPYVTAQSICKDLERNNAVGLEKRRRIVGKKSKGGIIDEDDIQLASNAGVAITYRDSIFKIVPAVIWRPAYEAARKVAIGDARTLTDRRQRAVEAFQKMGVPAERVLASIERSKLEEVTLEDLEILIGTFTAIREGSTTIENAFPPLPPKGPKKVERPNFGGPGEPAAAGGDSLEEEPEAPSAKPSAPATAPKRERKGKRAVPEEETVGELPLEAPQSRLFSALADWSTKPEEFIDDLKLIKFPGVGAEVELLGDLSDETCLAIFTKGLEAIFEEIREARWLAEQK